MEGFAIVVALAAYALFGWWLWRLIRRFVGRKSTAIVPLLMSPAPGFMPKIYDTTCRGRGGVAIDPVNNRFAVAWDGRRRVYNFEQVLAVEALLNGVPIAQGGGQANMVGAAVVGELLAGPLGALAGAAMAGSRIQNLTIRLLTDDLAEPWVDVPFLAEPRPQFQSHRRVRAALPAWKAWEGRFRTILARRPAIVALTRPERQFVS